MKREHSIAARLLEAVWIQNHPLERHELGYLLANGEPAYQMRRRGVPWHLPADYVPPMSFFEEQAKKGGIA